MSSPVMNYSTTIAATKTVSEMQQMLAEHGAQRIAVDYNGGSPAALTFSYETSFGPKIFTLPINVEAMRRLLIEKDRKGQLKTGLKAVRTSREQAERVAWRIMKDWLAAQLAIIEAGMTSLDEVMLPYLRVSESHTLYQSFVANELGLNAGSNA